MVTGRVLSSVMLEQFISAGNFATNFPAAYRKFGTNFIPVRPIPPSCIQAIYDRKDPDEQMEENTCYVPNPDTI